MKIRKFVKVAILILFISQSLSAQSLFKDDFNYTVLDSMDNAGGWERVGLNSNHNVQVKSPGLSYSGYIGSGNGKTAYFSNVDVGDVLRNSITAQNSGNVYLAYLIRVDSLTATATAGFNLCFDQGAGGNFFNTKLYVKRLSASTFNFGISKSTELTYSSNVYNTNTTYLAVLKYSFVNGSNNDSAKMYIYSSGIPVSEPAVPTAFNTAGVDIDNISAVILSNQYAYGGNLKSSSVKIDGIRVGTTWQNTLIQQTNVQFNLTAMIQGFYNITQNKMIKDTARVYLRYKTSPYNLADSSKTVLDSLGKGNFTFTRVSNNEPYYLAVRHRNSIEIWSFIPKKFENNALSFDFSTNPASAYGSNEILVGSKFCIYSGDVNQDGVIDISDGNAVDNNAFNGVIGYTRTDVNGDKVTDLSDAAIVDNNALSGVFSMKP